MGDLGWVTHCTEQDRSLTILTAILTMETTANFENAGCGNSGYTVKSNQTKPTANPTYHQCTTKQLVHWIIVTTAPQVVQRLTTYSHHWPSLSSHKTYHSVQHQLVDTMSKDDHCYHTNWLTQWAKTIIVTTIRLSKCSLCPSSSMANHTSPRGRCGNHFGTMSAIGNSSPVQRHCSKIGHLRGPPVARQQSIL